MTAGGLSLLDINRCVFVTQTGLKHMRLSIEVGKYRQFSILEKKKIWQPHLKSDPVIP